MAPALLELLQSHGRLPPSEPVAEYSCPQHDVRTLKATIGPRLSSARRRFAWSGGRPRWLMAVQMLAKHCHTGWDTGCSEHDMAEAGEIIHASMVRAGMRIRKSSADVSEEGADKKYAMRQAPCCDAALRSSAEECTAVHVWAQSSLPSCVSAGS